MDGLVSEEIIRRFEESEKQEFAKRMKYLSNLPREKLWKSTAHHIWLNGIVPASRCKLRGCACKLTNKGVCLLEADILFGVVVKIEDELKNFYPELDTKSFAVQIMVRQIALNMVRLMRANSFECLEGAIANKLHKFHEHYENPVTEYIRRLINQNLKLFKHLGLLPAQQLGKEAVMITKSLEMKMSKLYINNKKSQTGQENTKEE